MSSYYTDGRRIVNIDPEEQPLLSDSIDGMLILSIQEIDSEERAFFVLESDGNVGCFVLNDIFIVGRVSGFETIGDAIEALAAGEI